MAQEFNFEAFLNACLFDREMRALFVGKPEGDEASAKAVRARMKSIAVSLGSVANDPVHQFIDGVAFDQLIAMARQFNTGNAGDNTVGT